MSMRSVTIHPTHVGTIGSQFCYNNEPPITEKELEDARLAWLTSQFTIVKKGEGDKEQFEKKEDE